MNNSYFIFFFIVLLSEIIGTVSGFGSSILFVPLASLYFDYKMVLGITAIFHVFSNLSKIVLFNKGIRKDIVLKLGIPAVVFVILGSYFTTFIPTKLMEFLMNWILVILAFYLFFNFEKPFQPNNKNLFYGGVFSGFIAGIAGTGGAIRGLTLSAFQLKKEIFIASSAFIDLGVDFSRAVIYVSHGYFPSDYYFLIPFLIFISMLGSFLGKSILKYTSEKVFRYLVLIVILFTAFFQILKFFFQ